MNNPRIYLSFAILALGLLIPTAGAGVPPPAKTQICTGTVCLDVTHPPGRPPVLEQQALLCFKLGGTYYCRRF